MTNGETVEAMITSIGEPQLEKCLESVRSQTVPFDTVTHVSNVVPAGEAFRRGLSKITKKWFAWVAGDMVLQENAHETMISAIERNEDEKVWKFLFGLHDTFLMETIKSCTVMRTDVARLYKWPERLRFDTWGEVFVRRFGWKICRVKNTGLAYHWKVPAGRLVVVGTHFDNPSPFQIFSRFSRVGLKRQRPTNLTELYKRTRDPRYAFAISSWQFGSKKDFPIDRRSIDADFNLKLYDEFLGTDEGLSSYSNLKQSRGGEETDTPLQ